MSIVVKGAKMPNNCGACPLRLAWCTQRLYMITRPERCPLEPVRKGKWETDSYPMDDGEYLMTRCSVCGTAYEYGHDDRYCGFCGAEMSEGEEDALN